jgi:Na+-translocating ferredoxin:NAD+ oxidoreductase RnfD subunit
VTLALTAANQAAQQVRIRLERLRRFLRSPKGYLTVALLALALLATPSAGTTAALDETVLAVAGAVAIELLIVRVTAGTWRFPGSAMLTGLIVGLVLTPHLAWYVPVTASAAAIISKHVLRLGRSHTFNPAAAGLLAVYVLFASGQSWWGGLPDLPAPAIPLLIVAGYLVANRANKLPATLAFLGSYLALCTATALLGGSSLVADLFRPPFINAALFFGFFMATDPPTSPVQFGQQVWFGSIVAAIGFVTYIATGGSLYFLLAGALAGNAVYAAWRMLRRPRPVATYRYGGAGFNA